MNENSFSKALPGRTKMYKCCCKYEQVDPLETAKEHAVLVDVELLVE